MSVSNDGCANVRSTSSIAAVTDTITEVDVLAEAGNIGGGTSKTWSQGEHVVDASLLLSKLSAIVLQMNAMSPAFGANQVQEPIGKRRADMKIISSWRYEVSWNRKGIDETYTTRWELVDLRHGHGKGAGEESH